MLETYLNLSPSSSSSIFLSSSTLSSHFRSTHSSSASLRLASPLCQSPAGREALRGGIPSTSSFVCPIFLFSLFPAFSPLFFPLLRAPSCSLIALLSHLISPLCHPPSPTFRAKLILFHLYSRFPSSSHPIHLHPHLNPFPLLPSLRSSGVYSRVSQVG